MFKYMLQVKTYLNFVQYFYSFIKNNPYENQKMDNSF